MLIRLKRGQVWGLDLIVAFIIFFVCLVLIYFYAWNYVSTSSEDLNGLFYDADLAANLILSDNDFGIMTDGKINQSLLDGFDARSDEDKKAIIGVSNNFYFVIPEMEVAGNPQSSVGIMNITPIENLVKVTRIVLYRDKPTKFELYVWK